MEILAALLLAMVVLTAGGPAPDPGPAAIHTELCPSSSHGDRSNCDDGSQLPPVRDLSIKDEGDCDGVR